jgi:transcriptional regulator with XRE-family HTH domain
MLKAEQCRAGRALVEMSRETLAANAGVGVRTISDFETGRREPIRATQGAIRAALEAAGVELIPENGRGAGVRLKNAPDNP